MLEFYSDVWKTAWRESWARIRGGMREVIQFLIQTGVFLAILFFLPVLGQVQDEARLVLAGVGGLIASAVTMFLIELLKAPANIALADRAEVQRLGRALRFEENTEEVRAKGYEIYETWRRSLPKFTDTLDANWGPVAPVEEMAESFIAEHFEHSTLMSYRYGLGYHVEDEEKGTPSYYKRRFDAFHTILLSYPTKAERLFRSYEVKG